MMARRSLRNGAAAVCPDWIGYGAKAERKAGITDIVLSLNVLGSRARSRHVIAHGLHREPPDAPYREGDQRDGAERAPAAGIKRFFRQARGNEAGDEDVLPVG